MDQKIGLEINEARPHDKLPFRGAWLWVGSEMIHLMELPNPDPLPGRPAHGGRDRHACIAIKDVSKLKAILDDAGKLIFFSSAVHFIFDNFWNGCLINGRNVDGLHGCFRLQVLPTRLASPGGPRFLHETRTQMLWSLLKFDS